MAADEIFVVDQGMEAVEGVKNDGFSCDDDEVHAIDFVLNVE